LAATDPSLNYLLSSHVWRQDRNGFSHRDPGFSITSSTRGQWCGSICHRCGRLLSVTDHLRSRNCVNVVVAGKQPALQWLTMDRDDQAHGGAWHLGMGQQRP
jgi:xylulose-5-phosphate/fructose-6-phosphate phosphoketolase